MSVYMCVCVRKRERERERERRERERERERGGGGGGGGERKETDKRPDIEINKKVGQINQRPADSRSQEQKHKRT